MVECGDNACSRGQVCVMTETCCNKVDYACRDLNEECDLNDLARCMCFDTPVGYDPASGVVSCENFGCTTSCEGDPITTYDPTTDGPTTDGPTTDDTAASPVECGNLVCDSGLLCVQTDTCCNVTDYACEPTPDSCEGLRSVALAECVCFDTAAGYDAETRTVTCENFGCTTACPDSDSDTQNTTDATATAGSDTGTGTGTSTGA